MNTGEDIKYFASKMFKLSKKEKDMLEKTNVSALPFNYGEVERGYTSIEPFSGKEFSKSPEITVRDKPVITPMNQNEMQAYKTPEETLLHELGHVKSMKAQGFRDLTNILNPRKSWIGPEISAERFAQRIEDREKDKPNLSELSKLKKSKLHGRWINKYVSN